MKKMLSNVINKVSNVYAGMSSNASFILLLGQTKAPKSLVKKD